jgi:hypothetical protein
MYKFKSVDRFQIEGRGPVYVIASDQLPEDMFNAAELLTEVVLIDGLYYKVIGIEQVKSEHVGLLVTAT